MGIVWQALLCYNLSMTEKPGKPESAERELSIDEFFDICRKKFNADEDILKLFRLNLELNKVKIFRPKSIAQKFFEQQTEWHDEEMMPLYDKGLDLFFTLKMGNHIFLRAFIYAIKSNVCGVDWYKMGAQEQYNLADKWTQKNMGWYVSGEDFSLVKSFNYRGTKEEEEIFAEYENIDNV